MRPRVVVILCAAAGLGASLSFAGAGSFLPRSWQNGAYFDLFGSYERDDNRRTTQPFAWWDTFLRQKITLYSDGYVYHPRFLQYHVSLAGALKQEHYEASYLGPLGWKHDRGVEYETRLYFLAEHPYNIELFALRYEPLFKEQAATQHGSVETSHGVLAQYRRRPYLFHSKYSVDTIDTGLSSTEITRVGLDGEYFKHYDNGNQLSFTGAYNPSRSTTTHGLAGDTTQYLLGNVIDLKAVRLNSSVTWNDYDQTSATTGDFSSNQFAWYELMNAYFPYHLRSNVSYRRQENNSMFPDPVTGRRELTDDVDDFQIDVVHRLYQSLDTTYTYMRSARESSAGDTRGWFHTLTVNYTKTIPAGRLIAGTNLGRGGTDSRGRTDIANEPHPAVSVPGLFNLLQPNVRPGSVAVFLKSPLAPFNNIQLVENLNYTLAVTGNTTEVDILTLPPLFVVPGTFDFFASYSLSTGDYDLASRTFGFNTSVDLFDMMLTPYFSYVAIRSDVLSGTFPGTPLDSTTSTTGVRYQKGPLRARGEYQNLDWEVSPYRAWRGEVQYVGSLTRTTSAYGTAQYVHKYFPQGTSQDQAEPYTDTTTSAAGSLRKEIPSQGLAFSVGGSLSKTAGRIDTTASSLSSSLTWKIGKISLTAGANVYSSDTGGAATVESSRTHQYYYLMLRRQLF